MIWLACLTALAVSFATVRLVMSLAKHLGAVDAPNSDVVTHTTSTPLLGGVGFIVGTVASALLLTGFALRPGSSVGIGVLCAMGLYKDITRKDLSPKLQLVVQFACCALILTSVDMPARASLWEMAICIFAGAAMINAINYLDVSDGLCSAVSITVFAGLYFAGAPGICMCVAAALLGFFLWNRPKARIFMGDVGSFFIGACLYWFLADGILGRSRPWWMLLVLAVPYGELVTTTLIRLTRAKAITQGDASHVSLLLLNAGMSPWALIGLFSGVSVLFVGFVVVFIR